MYLSFHLPIHHNYKKYPKPHLLHHKYKNYLRPHSLHHTHTYTPLVPHHSPEGGIFTLKN